MGADANQYADPGLADGEGRLLLLHQRPGDLAAIQLQEILVVTLRRYELSARGLRLQISGGLQIQTQSSECNVTPDSSSERANLNSAAQNRQTTPRENTRAPN